MVENITHGELGESNRQISCWAKFVEVNGREDEKE
jgi:hypothetical protein